MLNLAPIALLLSGLLLGCLVAPMAGQACTSCGPECVSACGSRRYRTCCFNYLRKRRSPAAPGAPPAAAASASASSPASDLALSDLGAMAALGGPVAGLVGPGDALPDDLRLQFVVVPSDQDAQEQMPPPMSAAQSLLHRLLDAQQAAEAADGGGSLESNAATGAAPPPAPTQRHRAGGGPGAAAAGKDWLAALRHREGLVYNA